MCMLTPLSPLLHPQPLPPCTPTNYLPAEVDRQDEPQRCGDLSLSGSQAPEFCSCSHLIHHLVRCRKLSSIDHEYLLLSDHLILSKSGNVKKLSHKNQINKAYLWSELTLKRYHIYLAIKQGFPLSRMTKLN